MPLTTEVPYNKTAVLMMKFKTIPCKHFAENGCCEKGDMCDYAHGPEELRTVEDNVAGTGVARSDNSRFRFNVIAVANAIISRSSWSSKNAKVQPICNMDGFIVAMQVFLYDKLALEFVPTQVRVLQIGVPCAMSRDAHNAVLELLGSSIRVSGKPPLQWDIVDLSGNIMSGVSWSWHPLVYPLPWEFPCCMPSPTLKPKVLEEEDYEVKNDDYTMLLLSDELMKLIDDED